MTKEQINHLLNTYGKNKLAMLVYTDGKRITITKEMLDDNLLQFDDTNELVTIIEQDAIFSDLLCYKNRYITTIFTYEDLIGMIFVRDEEDMYYNGENGEGKVFMHRNPRLEEDNEVKLKEQYANIKE